MRTWNHFEDNFANKNSYIFLETLRLFLFGSSSPHRHYQLCCCFHICKQCECHCRNHGIIEGMPACTVLPYVIYASFRQTYIWKFPMHGVIAIVSDVHTRKMPWCYFAPQICFVGAATFVKSYHNNKKNRTEGLSCDDSVPIVWIYIKKDVKACLQASPPDCTTRLCGEFKYIVHKHIQQAANGTGLAADQARPETNIVHVGAFLGTMCVSNGRTGHLTSFWQCTKKTQTSRCGVCLRIRGPERLKLKSFRLILGSLILRRSQVFCCHNLCQWCPSLTSVIKYAASIILLTSSHSIPYFTLQILGCHESIWILIWQWGSVEGFNHIQTSPETCSDFQMAL